MRPLHDNRVGFALTGRSMQIAPWVLLLLLAANMVGAALGAEPVFLRRRLTQINEKPDDLSAEKAHYKPLFGLGDEEAGGVKGIARYGALTVNPGGRTPSVSYDQEEQAYFVLSGRGVLHYGDEKAPVKENDFVYLPPGVKRGLSNASDRPLRVLIMGYRIPVGAQMPPTPALMIASADDVPRQVLGGHGPTTQFKLLMGNARSTRDKIAAGLQIASLFEMDFAQGGTNIPHRHAREEEIYFVRSGHGEMVAGQTPDGKEAKHPCQEGDAFYFPPGTLVGFYSGAKEGEPHARIIAVRSPFPGPRAGN